MSSEYCEARLILSIDKIKQILKITDSTHDAALTAAAPIVTEYFENYTGRGLAYDDEVIEHKYIGPRIQLYRYPNVLIKSFLVNAVEQPYGIVNPVRGWIYLGWPMDQETQATIIYSGGYQLDCAPADLADAYAKAVGDFAAVPYEGSVSSGAAGSAPLKSLSLGSGALSVAFETATSASSAVYDTSDAPAFLQPYAFTLRRYQPQDLV